MFIYSIFDKKGNFHSSQFFAGRDSEAVRAFSRLVNDSRSDISLCPYDFALYCLGQLDPDTGIISPVSPIKHIVEASSLIKVEEK